MTRAWAPNGWDVVDWPAGKGLVVEKDDEDWRRKVAAARWSNSEIAAKLRAGLARAIEARRARAAGRKENA